MLSFPYCHTLPFIRVVDPLLLAGEGDDREDADDHEHDPCQCGGHAHLVGLEGVVVNQNGDQSGGVARAAVGDDERAVELLECLADLRDQVVEDDGGDHRDGDGEELLPLTGTVDGGRLIQVCGHALQSGQEQDHGGTELPDAQEADDPQRIVGVAQPGGALCVAEGDGADDGVDQTVIAEDGLPQNGDGNGAAQDGRDVVDGTEQVHAGDLEVQDVCDEQSEDQLQGHGDEGVLEGSDQGFGDLGIGEGSDVVHHAVLMDAVEEVHIGEAVVQRLTKRDRLEDDETDDPGDQIDQTLPLIEELLGRGTPQRGRITFFHPGILLLWVIFQRMAYRASHFGNRLVRDL